jgi:membrane protein DedA with SNARE-associated domain
MEILVNKVLFLLGNLDYYSVFLLMTLESSFIPFPSEVIVPPAAYLASRGELNLFLGIIVGSLGSLAGAVINYFIAYFLGRPLVYRIADHKISRMLLINSSKVKKAEDFFLRYGGLSTFIGRLVPGVRQLISLPAGFSRMNFGEFCFYTVLGAGLWVTILAILGYFFGANQDLLHQFAREISNTFLVLALLVLLFMLFYKKKKKRGREKAKELG